MEISHSACPLLRVVHTKPSRDEALKSLATESIAADFCTAKGLANGWRQAHSSAFPAEPCQAMKRTSLGHAYKLAGASDVQRERTGGGMY